LKAAIGLLSVKEISGIRCARARAVSGSAAALLAIDNPTGDIKAMVADTISRRRNSIAPRKRAADGKFLQVYVYADALESGMTLRRGGG